MNHKIESLKERAWQEVAAVDQALAEGRIDEDGWHRAMASIVRPAYLAADNPYAQVGHGGDAETWNASRGFLADVLHRDGTFLDVGCAGGLMMESVVEWGATKGLHIEPYGLEIIPELVDLARRRLPAWAGRIHEGNIRTWIPPGNERFDYVLLRPEYAPLDSRRDMVRHVLRDVLKPDGRLIVFVGTEEQDDRVVERSMTGDGLAVSGRMEISHPEHDRLVRRLFWIDGE